MNDVVQAIQSVGFPVVCVLMLFYFVKYMYDKNDSRTQELTNVINDLKNAINLMIEKLNDKGDKNES